MSYQCLDCSYTKRGTFPDGRCPACGSYNVGRCPTGETEAGRSATYSHWRLGITVGLWLLLAYLLYGKL